MSWKIYSWVWQLLSPVHVGTTPAGSLNRTRLYVPARTLWGALTAQLARKEAGDAPPDYGGTGERLSEKCRFSYLFPAQKEGERYLAWLPRYEDAEGRGLVWHREDNEGNKKADREFRLWMLTVRPGTAISPSTDAALEATLREYELLADWSFWGKQKVPQPVFLKGYVFCREADVEAEVLEMEELFLGGDTRYGLGRVRRVHLDGQPPEGFFGKPLDLSNREPMVSTDTLLAHAAVQEVANTGLSGAREQLVEWDNGQLKAGPLAWVPGSRTQSDPLKWKIGEGNLWEPFF